MAKECIHHDNSLDDYRKLVAGYIHAFKMCIKPNKKDFTSYLNRAAFTTNTLKMLHNMVIMLTEGATNEDLYYYAEKF